MFAFLAGHLGRIATLGRLPPMSVVKQSVIGWVLGAVLLLTAYVAFVFALWFYVETTNGPVIASGAVGVVMIALTLTLWGAVAFLNHLARRRAWRERQERAASLQVGVSDVTMAALPLLFSKHPLATLLAVSGTAYLLTRQKRGR